MRRAIESILNKKQIDFFQLPLSARVLLVTDGTVTELLEALVSESLYLSFKQQDDKTNEQLTIDRRIVLSGEKSNIPWLYAESKLYTEVLPFSIQQQLQNENLPIGSIFQQLKSDTHREMLDCGYMHHIPAAEKLHLDDNFNFLYRRYHIVAQHAPLMQICEWFPYNRIDAKIEHLF